ncbi:MAG: UDP-N-acetylmuramoyl-tripeptide--D-alanyl-D-alanine ligase [Aquimarina sp.]|nr:UDP-N-acetylmuramoyl-tripeptide--D-alanyl-D-alanine ligase [Aquimarina sp.]
MDTSKLHSLFLDSTGISTDTRKIKQDNIFFALKGENFNGNTYANQALESGASYAVVDEKEYATNERSILVPDCLKALQKLANYHRNYLKLPILALTGSNGKTTTKELINVVLSKKFKTVATKGNLNNHIGVPLTLLEMNTETEFGIVEMGANHQKEIEFLCNIAQPNYGYITNIGKAHLEGFGGIEGVLKGKTEMYQHLKENQQMIFLNREDIKLTNASKGIKSYSFSQREDADIQIKFIDANPMVQLKFEETKIHSNLIGAYNFTNVAAAIAIGKYFNISSDSIKDAIESYIPENNRSQILKKKDNIIIMDAYNANPSSMQAAIENFEKLSANTKTVFLGDMFELGPEAKEEHQAIVSLLETTSIDLILIIGENFYRTITKSQRIKKYRTSEDLHQDWNPNLIGKANLIKGSRGMKLERILDLID